jgi:hypothetical protein
MKKDMYETNTAPDWTDQVAVELEKECEIWDWARTAGVSALDLRMALLDSMSLAN